MATYAPVSSVVVSGADRNYDGIPDALQGSREPLLVSNRAVERYPVVVDPPVVKQTKGEGLTAQQQRWLLWITVGFLLAAMALVALLWPSQCPVVVSGVADITSATHADFDINIPIAHWQVKCSSETIAIGDTAVTFPNIKATGDCMGDALRLQNKDVTKYSLTINSDGTLTFHSDGYTDMKMSKASFAAAAAPSGNYHNSVPSIIDITARITSATLADFKITLPSSPIAKQEVKCSGETIAIGDTAATFPNIKKKGDCMGDALRGQNKDVTKYSFTINSDGTLTFHSDGYPDMKLSKASDAAAAAPSGIYYALVSDGCQLVDVDAQSDTNTPLIGVLVAVGVLALCAGCCHAIFSTKDGSGTCNEVLALVAGFFIPPLGIWWRFGCGIHFLICCVLTLCGYVPGVIFAMVCIICKPVKTEQ